LSRVACLPIWSVARSLTQTTHTHQDTKTLSHTKTTQTKTKTQAGTSLPATSRRQTRQTQAGALPISPLANIRKTQTRKLTHFHSHTYAGRDIENTYTHTIPFGAHRHDERCKETHKACCPRQRDHVRRHTKLPDTQSFLTHKACCPLSPTISNHSAGASQQQQQQQQQPIS